MMNETARAFESDYEAVIEMVEAGERIYREEFRAGVLAGMYAPHVMREDGSGAFCDECDLFVLFIVSPNGTVLDPPTVSE